MPDTLLLALLDTFFQKAPLALCFFEQEDFVHGYFNQAYQDNILGRQARSLPFLQVLPELRDSLVFSLMQKTYYSGATVVEQEHAIDMPTPHGEQQKRYFSFIFQPWLDDEGHVKGILTATSDVTQSALSRQHLQKEKSDQDEMFRMMSHDLRNPIGSAKMAMDAIARNGGATERVVRKAQRASAALHRADNMISHFLDLHVLRADDGLSLQPVQQALRTIISVLVHEMNLSLHGRVHLSVQDDGNGLWDAEYIARALGNLIENAAKYGAANAAIDVCLGQDNHGRIFVRVHNEGPALSEETQAAMMHERPWRAEGHFGSKQGGWGMGMPLVHAVAKAHGGHLSLHSSDAGTDLCLWFDPVTKATVLAGCPASPELAKHA